MIGLIWFCLGAICGGTAIALLVAMSGASIGMPGSRRKWGRPQ